MAMLVELPGDPGGSVVLVERDGERHARLGDQGHDEDDPAIHA
jgi:hypothetical protein